MNVDLSKLRSQAEQFCTSPSSLLWGEGKALLVELLQLLYRESDCITRNNLEQLIDTVQRAAGMDAPAYANLLHSVALKEYEDGDTGFLEFLFRSACKLVEDNTIGGNLACLLRRKGNDTITNGETIDLLLPGVKEQDPYAIINMGLLFALNLSAPDDWETADELFSLLPKELNKADSWWEALGKKDEDEGYLVHYFLLRHGKLDHSKLGSIESITAHLTKTVPGFSAWLARAEPEKPC